MSGYCFAQKPGVFFIICLNSIQIFTDDLNQEHVDVINGDNTVNTIDAFNAIKWPELKSVKIIPRPCLITVLSTSKLRL